MITMSTPFSKLYSTSTPVVSGTYLKSAELLFLLQCTVDALCSKIYSIGLQLCYIEVVHSVVTAVNTKPRSMLCKYLHVY